MFPLVKDVLELLHLPLDDSCMYVSALDELEPS